jgi:hypothetical protein
VNGGSFLRADTTRELVGSGLNLNHARGALTREEFAAGKRSVFGCSALKTLNGPLKVPGGSGDEGVVSLPVESQPVLAPISGAAVFLVLRIEPDGTACATCSRTSAD